MPNQLESQDSKIEDITNDPEEPWTEAPHGDDESDAELVAALREREDDDVEEADESVERVPMAHAEARKASEALRIFVHENQTEQSELRECMAGIENLTRLIAKMTFSARSKQTRVTDFFSRCTCGWRQRLIIGAPP